jgi:uncharacterized LabA/DUF88 family protein
MSLDYKIALFIDGPNFYRTARYLNFDVDYKALLKTFEARGRILRAFYYTTTVDDQEFNSARPLIDWLGFNGFTVVTKPTKEFVDPTGIKRIKGSMNVEIAVDMMHFAASVDEMFLFSGDGDFQALVAAVQREGVRVSVVSSLAMNPPMIADELRRQADEFIDVASLPIQRQGVERPPRKPRTPT